MKLHYRKTNENDPHLLAKYIACDSDHANKCTPEFFTVEEKNRVECFVPEDDIGAVFYCRAENVLRLHLQFPPVYSREEKVRLARAIDTFTQDIQRMSKDRYKQIIFESVSEGLTDFLTERGFRASKSEWILDL
jgi:hypothetical protein